MSSFLFDRRSMALLLSGMAAAGLLLFAGGVFVGLQMQLESSGPVTVAQFRPLGPGEPTASAPLEPAPTPATDEPEPTPAVEPEAQPASTLPPAAPPSEPSETTPEPVTALNAEASALPEPDLPEQALVLAVEPQPAPTAQPAVLEDLTTPPQALPASLPATTTPLAAAASAPAPELIDESVPILTHGELAGADGEPTFGIQVAAFELRSTASRIAAELIRRGWEAYLVPFATPSGRRMYSIRFGRFSDGREAYRAAREFEERERTPTLVRLQLDDG